jgi:hypothetical protein
MYLMSNDAKWMEKEVELSFIPYPGMDFEGLADEQPLRISGMVYNVEYDYFKLRLAWLSPDPLDSKVMVGLGWAMK